MTEIRLNESPPVTVPIIIRTLFLSDFHFGYKGVDGAALLECLQTYQPQFIYLAGDIIDGWKLSKRWHWRAEYTRIFDAIVDHKKRGAKIIYLPGNHDERVRKATAFRRARFGFLSGIRIRNQCVHKTADGKRIIVMHGDQFDNVLISGSVSKFGDWLHERFSEWLGVTQPPPRILIDGRMRKFSLAKALMKRSSKAALALMNNLEGAVGRLIKRKGADGLICGHTHVPALHALKNGKIFGNCGMWMGHTNTAIIEQNDGRLELVHWRDMRSFGDDGICASSAVHIARHIETARTIRKIRQLWPGRVAGQVKTVLPQALQGQKGIIDQKGWDPVHVAAMTPLGDELGAQA